MPRPRTLATALSAALVWSAGASACSLRIVPAGFLGGQEELKGWGIKPELSYTEFRLPEGAGGYLRESLTAEFRPRAAWVAGAELPLVSLRGDANGTALGAPVLFAERLLFARGKTKLSGGSQLGLPGGGRARGASPGHAELLPYLTGLYDDTDGAGYLYLNAGARVKAGGDGHGEEPPLFVEPHEDAELVFRAGGGLHWEAALSAPELFLDGQQALDGHDAGTLFLSAGLFWPVELGDTLDLVPFFEGPLTAPKRFQWRGGLRLEARF